MPRALITLCISLLLSGCTYLLTITSEPSGATVDLSTLYYKGKRLGVGKTPVTVKLNNWDRAQGNLMVFQNGYNPGTVTFKSWWGKNVAYHCVLKPKDEVSQSTQVPLTTNPTAFLYLSSTIGTIDVFADEKFIGKINEAKENFKVNSGDFNLIAKKNGIEVERIAVSLNENEGFMYVFNSTKPNQIKDEKINAEGSRKSQFTVISQKPEISIIFNGFERILPYQTILDSGEYEILVKIGPRTYKKLILIDRENIVLDLDKEVFR